MIGWLEGEIRNVSDGHVILMCGGVGYKVFATTSLLSRARMHAPLSFPVRTIVREDTLDLFGFESEAELRFFELLLAVPGVGPRSALSILDVAPVETLRSAVASGNADYLTKVSGIGRKKAEKIVIELRDKVGLAEDSSAHVLRGDEDALEAMRALGYTAEEARNALRAIPTSVEGGAARLKEALKTLGRTI